MNEMTIINKSTFLGKEIDVYGTAENPLFLAKDVAEWIEHSDVSMMVKSIDECEKVTSNVCTLGGSQNAWFLTEDGLYEVLMQSRKPQAKQFKKGVKEILKTIRKTGGYSSPTAITPKDKVEAGIAWIDGCRKLLSLSDASILSLMSKVALPLGLPVPDYVSSKGVLHSASELLKKHNVGMTANKFNALLIQKGLLTENERQGVNKIHKFKVITPKGLEYGENEVSPHNQKETQPHWYDDKFGELLSVVGIQ